MRGFKREFHLRSQEGGGTWSREGAPDEYRVEAALCAWSTDVFEVMKLGTFACWGMGCMNLEAPMAAAPANGLPCNMLSQPTP
eukprot:1142985-Pelagomonas_calceolata.AAC.4